MRTRNRNIPAGLDGCYIVADLQGGRWSIGTDSRGLMPLFVYQTSTSWAIASSLYKLVLHLRRHGAVLTPNLAVLSAFGAQREFTDQLATLQTQFNEISLLPSFSSIIIESNNLQVQHSEPYRAETYREALSDYIHTWRSRLATCTSNEFARLHVDLSGGIDSRTVFAFALADEQFNTGDERFTVGSGPNQERDYEIATRIVGAYGRQFGRSTRGASRWSQDRALEAWREDSLGVYLPFYRHGGTLDPFAIHAHGAGGGNFRPHFLGSSIESPVDRCRSLLPAEYFEDWRSAAIEGATALQKYRPDVHPLVLHYREFRNRFHFGHRPRHSVVFTPLESGMTDALTDKVSDRDARQLYFDVMETLAPGLKDVEFDDPAKAATPKIMRNLTIAELTPPIPGAIFGSPLHHTGEDNTVDAYAEWMSEGLRALNLSDVHDFMGTDLAHRAFFAVSEFESSDRRLPPHNRNLMNVSFARNIEFTLNL